MKWQILILMVFLTIPLALASEDAILTFSTNQEVNLSVLCSYQSGSLCNATSTCVMDTYYPNGTQNYTSKVMDYNGSGFFNATLGTYTEEGDYKTLITCDDGHTWGYSRQDFRISKNLISGEIGMLGQAFILLVIFALMVFLFLSSEKYEDKNPIETFVKLMLKILAIALFPVITLVLTNMLAGESYSRVFEIIHMITLYSVFAIVVGAIAYAMYGVLPFMHDAFKKFFSNR